MQSEKEEEEEMRRLSAPARYSDGQTDTVTPRLTQQADDEEEEEEEEEEEWYC
jgi:hypothetical protein